MYLNQIKYGVSMQRDVILLQKKLYSPFTTSLFSSYIHEEQQSELKLCIQHNETDLWGDQVEKLFNLQKQSIYPLTCTYAINTVFWLFFSQYFSFPYILYKILYREIVCLRHFFFTRCFYLLLPNGSSINCDHWKTNTGLLKNKLMQHIVEGTD